MEYMDYSPEYLEKFVEMDRVKRFTIAIDIFPWSGL